MDFFISCLRFPWKFLRRPLISRPCHSISRVYFSPCRGSSGAPRLRGCGSGFPEGSGSSLAASTIRESRVIKLCAFDDFLCISFSFVSSARVCGSLRISACSHTRSLRRVPTRVFLGTCMCMCVWESNLERWSGEYQLMLRIQAAFSRESFPFFAPRRLLALFFGGIRYWYHLFPGSSASVSFNSCQFKLIASSMLPYNCHLIFSVFRRFFKPPLTNL